MFDQTFVNTHANTRKFGSVAASLAAQTMLVGTLLLIPLLHPEILYPKIDAPVFIHLQPVKPIVQAAVAKTVSTGSTAAPKIFQMPRNIPTGVKQAVDANIAAPETFVGAIAAPGNGQGSDIFSNLIQSGLPTAPPPVVPKPAPPVVKPPAPAGPIQVSSGVQAAKLISGPKPAYPQLARAARVQGTVRIQAIIAADGTIGNLKTMSGPPLLITAAVEAVSRWRYQPTLLSGKAVEVITEIDVIFTLGQ
jgi:protein TonB